MGPPAGRAAPPPTLADGLERVQGAARGRGRRRSFLTEVAGHLIKAGGKRQRPAFAMAAALTAAQEAGPGPPRSMLGGVAVELVHLGSLYHDDVMDEVTTRHFVESVNARWGNLQAILAGDFLAKASEIAASLGTEVAGLLAATIARLCEGSHRAPGHLPRGPHRGRYFRSINGKTAALFATACRIGASSAASPRRRSRR